MILYNAFLTSQGPRISKWDPDLNVERSYLVSEHGCECPAAKPCKHMAMLHKFQDDGEFNKQSFYCRETDTYYEWNP